MNIRVSGKYDFVDEWMKHAEKGGKDNSSPSAFRRGIAEFEINDVLTFSMFAEGVWMDKRRFNLRYGGEPDGNTIGGGAVAFVLSGARLDWKVPGGVTIFASYTQYDLVNPQARDLVKARGRYCDKCDWPIARAGIAYSF